MYQLASKNKFVYDNNSKPTATIDISIKGEIVVNKNKINHYGVVKEN